MNKKISILLTWLLVYSTAIAFTGIPFYTMICKQDGHVQRAIIKTHAICEHEHQQQHKTKSCCQSESPCESDSEEDCCDFNSDLLKLEIPATTKTEQEEDFSIQLLAITYFLFYSNTSSLVSLHNSFTSPDSHIAYLQCHRTFTCVYRI